MLIAARLHNDVLTHTAWRCGSSIQHALAQEHHPASRRP